MPPVYNSRAPGATNFIPRAAPAAGAAPAPINRFVYGLPQAGSPLMQQLVKFIQARNPAMVINEGNVQANMPAMLDVMPGTHFRIPGPGRNLLRQLQAAGLGQLSMGGAYPNSVPAGSTFADLASSPHWQQSILARGGNARGIGELGLAQAGQPSFSGGGVSAPPMVPVNTLPEPALPAPLPAPIAQTPVGPMYYPPGQTSSLFGSRDPRRLFR